MSLSFTFTHMGRQNAGMRDVVPLANTNEHLTLKHIATL